MVLRVLDSKIQKNLNPTATTTTLHIKKINGSTREKSGAGLNPIFLFGLRSIPIRPTSAMDFSHGWYCEEEAEAEELEEEQTQTFTTANMFHKPPFPLSSVANNSNDDNNNKSRIESVEREHMFDKVVTPSDVGKLNRLVIPKQHAEKYFPLDSSSNEKGLLLNFEDRSGKPWRFRYSYWNSSQSYVMTKGWSRFVKEKKLDAGDVVSFQRGVGETGRDRLFIDWRRRPDGPDPIPQHRFSLGRSLPYGPLFFAPPQPQGAAGVSFNNQPILRSINMGQRNFYAGYNVVNPFYYVGSTAQQVGLPATAAGDEAVVFDSVPVVQGKVAAKRLRLFGVNMECPISESDHSECENPYASLPSHHHSSSSSSSNSSIKVNPLQLRLYNGGAMPITSKGKASSSFDLDI